MPEGERFDLKAYLYEKRAFVDDGLERLLPEARGPAERVIEAMRYSVFAGGKRLRPILCLAAAEGVSTDPDVAERVLPMACALELIHTYSLIHDDLPAMDDDDLRRGKPTNHKLYGEAIALLAGDGLLTEAFHLMTRPDLMVGIPPAMRLQAVAEVARAAGYEGMVGGQSVDILSEGKPAELPLVEYIHKSKTGAMLSASLCVGAMLAGCREERMEAVRAFGEKVGLAFQISDDILGVEGDPALLGKAVGADEKRGKKTYPALLGIARSKAIRESLVASAIAAVQDLPHRAEPLRHIARYMIERRR